MADTTTSSLKDEFNDLMETLYERTKLGTHNRYRPTRWLQGLRECNGDGVGYVRHLLATQKPQTGLGRLAEEGRLDLSMEMAVLNPRYETLFKLEDRAKAWERLRLQLLAQQRPA